VDITATELWQDVLELPVALRATLDGAEGFDEVAGLLSRPGVERIVATGNGASYYVAVNLWLASLAGPGAAAEVVAIPAGLIATGDFAWRPGDALLAISSSGEFRDVVEAAAVSQGVRACAAITGQRDSALGRLSTARALISTVSERAETHTQQFCGSVLASLAVWARLTGDSGLMRELEDAVEQASRSVTVAETWAGDVLRSVETPIAGIAFGSGAAWAAALETALLMKEVARLPWEGVETREGATSATYALGPRQLALVIESRPDPLVDEAESACARLGATVLRLPGPAVNSPLAAISSFPSATAAAIVFALREGHSVDRPGWVDGYYATARRNVTGTDSRVDALHSRTSTSEVLDEK